MTQRYGNPLYGMLLTYSNNAIFHLLSSLSIAVNINGSTKVLISDERHNRINKILIVWNENIYLLIMELGADGRYQLIP